jgi:RsiW-degrading membrane proteinase PrsW (M82 family)
MKLLISISLAVIPVIYLLIHFYKKDNLRPEPKGLIFKVFVWGFLSTFIVAIIEIIVSTFNIFRVFPLLSIAFSAFIVAGFIEEGAKLFIIKKTVYHNEKFDEIMDGIVYTITVSLGFACLENIIYVIGGGLTTAILRGLTAVPMHAFMSGIMGFYIGMAKFAKNKAEEKKLIKKGFKIAIILHGLYDFLLMLIKAFPSIGVILLILVVIELIYSGKYLKKLIIEAKKTDKESERV